MTVTLLPTQGHEDQNTASEHQASKTKIIFISLLFVASLASFVLQTELTSHVFQLGFNEPVVMLLVTHGAWWILWPTQVLLISIWRTGNKIQSQSRNRDGGNSRYQRLDSNSQLLDNGDIPTRTGDHGSFEFLKYFRKTIVRQVRNVYHTSILIYEANVNDDTSTYNCHKLIDQNPRISSSSSLIECFKTFVSTESFKYIFVKSAIITVILTVAGGSWFVAMAMTYASDVTAIYNCSAFTAYAFAIPILHEKLSWLKASSVVAAVAGVFIVAYSDDGSSDAPDGSKGEELYPNRLWGNLIIFIGAILYGYYEVLYKKFTCIPPHLVKIITPRRQLTFANFIMSLFGVFTAIILVIVIVFGEIFHIHSFNFFDYGKNTTKIWIFICGSSIANILFSASFLSLMALTNPVLSSVSSLLTIFLIGIVEWFLFGNKLSFQQLLGDCFVIIGFIMLTTASWKEISEGNDDDDVENVSTLSFALSTEG
ncbi:DEHA2B15422p [Debaryomyces hansenii CBS767]|uniref:DEHA2B15422p n=1 Tax=Debaryomyces hansenii (strain ATCC 36239 / CBS 767 / BCRC 21394 / JCM 1990 / NBRC 0083 / IGC 2968) TaxID=284592 RepID=B5RSW4_DEBHA|nr:DEHA2B15422p [Debaryomyces hansenii CBS767]CAR65501.1 DEHA2B15422p [Debaryomyces hansenii CBS767]|eukprot:XP_002770132.1 DEHA2B15422p [Debaryomyces hansenii CBS767]